ncbi:LysM peptidoglycan-binding domain-containing protein [Micromonospora sp. WMMD736]|uniref:LysM peptidoglycan-binding domain-containing protein n=1 Tax=Micromonospora sp. WMMD736 TaxID=3404112 RepID=UPI003B96429B
MPSTPASLGWLRAGLMLLFGGVALLGPLPGATVALAAPPPSPAGAGSAEVPAATAGVVPSPGSSRYYQVGPPQGGQRDYLYQIAVRTLGDGNRYREIFELNQGRLQADNRRLTDPLAALQPGWVLELPADARGPGVQVGPLPLPSATASAAAASSSRADDTNLTSYLVGIAGLMVAFLIAVVLWRVLRDPRSATPKPAASSADRRAPKVTTVLPEPPAVTTAAPVDTASEQPDTAPGAPTAPAAEIWKSGRAAIVLEPLAGNPADLLDVRLMGAAPGLAAEVPCGWLGDEHLADAMMPVVLGQVDGRQFVVDFAAAPDVFTVTGTPSAARRQARALAERLQVTLLAVTVVGDVLGVDLPRGWRRVDTFPTTQRDIAMLPQPSIIISPALSGTALTSARELAARTNHRVIPVLVGEMVRTRWSVRVTEPKP